MCRSSVHKRVTSAGMPVVPGSPLNRGKYRKRLNRVVRQGFPRLQLPTGTHSKPLNSKNGSLYSYESAGAARCAFVDARGFALTRRRHSLTRGEVKNRRETAAEWPRLFCTRTFRCTCAAASNFVRSCSHFLRRTCVPCAQTSEEEEKKETKARGKEKGKAARCLESVFQAETAMTSWRTYEVVQVRSSASWTIVSTRNGVRCELSRENVLAYPKTGVEMRRGIQRMPPSVPRGDVACRYLSVKVVFKLLLLRVVRLHRMIMMLMALFSLCTEGES